MVASSKSSKSQQKFDDQQRKSVRLWEQESTMTIQEPSHRLFLDAGHGLSMVTDIVLATPLHCRQTPPWTARAGHVALANHLEKRKPVGSTHCCYGKYKARPADVPNWVKGKCTSWDCDIHMIVTATISPMNWISGRPGDQCGDLKRECNNFCKQEILYERINLHLQGQGLQKSPSKSAVFL